MARANGEEVGGRGKGGDLGMEGRMGGEERTREKRERAMEGRRRVGD